MNWYKKIAANEEYRFTPHSPDGFYEDGYEDVDHSDLANQADQIANSSGIRILRDKELNQTVRDSSGKVVGALYTSIINDVFSFDIVVDPNSQGQGIGSQLVESAILEFNNYKFDMMPNLKMEADVVSPVMKHILDKKGWRVKKRVGKHIIMISSRSK